MFPSFVPPVLAVVNAKESSAETIMPVKRKMGLNERRESRRLPIEQDVWFQSLDLDLASKPGSGKTMNMSSVGVLFTTDCMIEVGQHLELTVDWPVVLDNGVHLKLVACGRVVRSESGLAAIQIKNYEFRTRRVIFQKKAG